MKRGLLVTVLCLVLICVGAAPALGVVSSPHNQRIQLSLPETTYHAPLPGSLPISPGIPFNFPYPDSLFTVNVTAPETVNVGEPFSIGTSISGTSDTTSPEWAMWMLYQQLLIPNGVTGPTSWAEQFSCSMYPDYSPNSATGAVPSRSFDWLSQSEWYMAGPGLVPYMGGNLLVVPEAIGHPMRAWAWLDDLDASAWSFSDMVIDEPGDYSFELFFNDSIYIDSMGHYDWAVDYEPLLFTVHAVDPVIPANIEIKAETINSKAKGNWITAWIEVPGYEPADIDVSTVKLAGVSADFAGKQITDRDEDGIMELTVRFPRIAVAAAFDGEGQITVPVTGMAGSASFAGTGEVRVNH